MSRIHAAGLAMVCATALTGCDPLWEFRVVVVEAATSGDSSEQRPVAGATVSITCPEGSMSSQLSPLTLTTDDAGRAVTSGLGYGIDVNCTVEVRKAGYHTRSWTIADVCARESDPRQPVQCWYGSLWAELSPKVPRRTDERSP